MKCELLIPAFSDGKQVKAGTILDLSNKEAKEKERLGIVKIVKVESPKKEVKQDEK